MAILVVGKCSANFGRQILGKALEFPGKRLQKSLPECYFTLDTDFDWLRKTNLLWQFSWLKISRTSVVMYCHIVRMAFLDLILQTDSASNDGMSSDKEEYLNLAFGVVSGVSRQVFWSFLDILFQCFVVAMTL